MSFDAMNLRDNGPGSPMDHHHQQHQHQMQNQQHQYQQQQQPQHQRRYSQYGSERGPTSPLTRKNTGGHPGSGNVSQRNSMGMNGMVMGVMNSGMNGSQSLSGKRPPNRLSVANMVRTKRQNKHISSFCFRLRRAGWCKHPPDPRWFWLSIIFVSLKRGQENEGRMWVLSPVWAGHGLRSLLFAP